MNTQTIVSAIKRYLKYAAIVIATLFILFIALFLLISYSNRKNFKKDFKFEIERLTHQKYFENQDSPDGIMAHAYASKYRQDYLLGNYALVNVETNGDRIWLSIRDETRYPDITYYEVSTSISQINALAQALSKLKKWDEISEKEDLDVESKFVNRLVSTENISFRWEPDYKPAERVVSVPSMSLRYSKFYIKRPNSLTFSFQRKLHDKSYSLDISPEGFSQKYKIVGAGSGKLLRLIDETIVLHQRLAIELSRAEEIAEKNALEAAERQRTEELKREKKEEQEQERIDSLLK